MIEINNHGNEEVFESETVITVSRHSRSASMVVDRRDGEHMENYMYGEDERDAVLKVTAILWQPLEIYFLGETKMNQIPHIIHNIGEGDMGLIGFCPPVASF